MKRISVLLVSMLAVVVLHAQETLSVTWLSSADDSFGQTIVSNEDFVSNCSWNAGGLTLDAKTAFDVSYTAFAGGADGTGGYVPVTFSVTPASGYIFIPEEISFKACKFGTDNSFATVKMTYDDGTTVTVAELNDKESIGRSNGTPAPQTHTYKLDNVKQVRGKVVLAIELNIAKNNKQVGLADVCLSGKIGKAFAVNVNANHNSYGSVSASTPSVIAGETLTLTATPRNHCEFVNWTDEDGTVVATEAVYSFTPDGDVNYTANFVLEEGYVERSFDAAPFSIAWPLADAAYPGLVSFTRNTVFESSFYADNGLTLSQDKLQDEYYTRFISNVTESVWADNQVVFSFTPNDGLVFIPRQLSFKAFQTGADIGNINAFITYSDGSESIWLAEEKMPRGNAEVFTIDLDETKVCSGTVTVMLNLSIYGSKSISISNVTVTGVVDGTTFVNEYNISAKANNDEYGTVKVLQQSIQVWAHRQH